MLQYLYYEKDKYFKKVTKEGVILYNALANRYAYLDIPAFDPIDVHFADYGIKISFALLKGNIAYLHFDGFSLIYYMDESTCKESFPNPDKSTQEKIGK